MSPDGRWLAVLAADGSPALFPMDGGPLRPTPAITRGEGFAGWLADSRAFLVRAVASPVLAHRLVLDVDRVLRGEGAPGVIQAILGSVPVPPVLA